MPSPRFVLIHSPLVGPLTWALVAEVLARRGVEAIMPRLTSPPELRTFFWQRHVEEVAQAVGVAPGREPLVLVAHSGAGVLLPAVGQRLAGRVAAYLFVDAGIPERGKSRLDLFESPEAAEGFRRSASDGLLALWRDEDLRDAIPDASVRARFVAELRPLPLAVYEEEVPVPGDWPFPRRGNPPCGYLRFGANPAYHAAAARARREGWPYRALDGGHFLMLVEPERVAMALLELAAPTLALSGGSRRLWEAKDGE